MLCLIRSHAMHVFVCMWFSPCKFGACLIHMPFSFPSPRDSSTLLEHGIPYRDLHVKEPGSFGGKDASSVEEEHGPTILEAQIVRFAVFRFTLAF
jgi:hypothetical protein